MRMKMFPLVGKEYLYTLLQPYEITLCVWYNNITKQLFATNKSCNNTATFFYITATLPDNFYFYINNYKTIRNNKTTISIALNSNKELRTLNTYLPITYNIKDKTNVVINNDIILCANNYVDNYSRKNYKIETTKDADCQRFSFI